ncbi:isochorismate synthase [Urechidicola croceus]|uniref:isochorismate synthase n=1 Tax=Urechidicola croceus TaxID=1850246 RepID=A0A1D8P3U0_9FLAO|nr:isochorismate synthase [Urechidicola croceus]AOW19249.1 hypothetical protein LPB138_00465 [Urechidicola croceus]
MIEIEERIENSFKNNLPFTVFRKPNSEEVKAVFQKENCPFYTKNFEESGFVFAPFSNKEEVLIIPYSEADVISLYARNHVYHSNQEIGIFETLYSDIDKNKHIQLVEKGIDFINTSGAKKIVLSRKEKIKIEDFNLMDVLKKLLFHYPTAFVYVWFHPKTGLWLGATPETLLSITDGSFKVMALASTQEYKGVMDVAWGFKEIQEHQYVVDFISSQINSDELDISNTYTVKAGNLLHLRADISGELSKDSSILNLINALHPTPATCGLPKEISKNFILENENYDREYYTGFLGEINNNSFADLFVNLRCMKVDTEKSEVSLFVGGGITKDSIPENEWEETVAKTNVMKKVL